MSGVVLSCRRAIVIAVLIWLIHQVIGFGIRDYPLSATAFIWGALMGMGTLLVVAISSIRPRFSQSSWASHYLWVAIALIGGFLLYQGPIMLAYPMLADWHFTSWEIIVKPFVKQLIWTVAIAFGHGVLLWRYLAQFRLAQD